MSREGGASYHDLRAELSSLIRETQRNLNQSSFYRARTSESLYAWTDERVRGPSTVFRSSTNRASYVPQLHIPVSRTYETVATYDSRGKPQQDGVFLAIPQQMYGYTDSNNEGGTPKQPRADIAEKAAVPAVQVTIAEEGAKRAEQSAVYASDIALLKEQMQEHSGLLTRIQGKLRSVADTAAEAVERKLSANIHDTGRLQLEVQANTHDFTTFKNHISADVQNTSAAVKTMLESMQMLQQKTSTHDKSLKTLTQSVDALSAKPENPQADVMETRIQEVHTSFQRTLLQQQCEWEERFCSMQKTLLEVQDLVTQNLKQQQQQISVEDALFQENEGGLDTAGAGERYQASDAKIDQLQQQLTELKAEQERKFAEWAPKNTTSPSAAAAHTSLH